MTIQEIIEFITKNIFEQLIAKFIGAFNLFLGKKDRFVTFLVVCCIVVIIVLVLLQLNKHSLEEKYTNTQTEKIQQITHTNKNFTETTLGINMKMIWVDGGSFLMGCTSEQGNDCNDDEKNIRCVMLDGFYIGMLEVTQLQWKKVMGTSIYQQKNKRDESLFVYGVGGDYPMYYVNWNEAMEFCRLLSNKTGRTYTLPTEAQWEYAARGGNKSDGTKYAGSNVLDEVAWYEDNSGNTTHLCGTKRANALGIYDMSGNVCEWCHDWYSSSYANYDTNNPTGPSSGSGRVYRGGSWAGDGCRVALRARYSPWSRGNYLGFRVVCIPEQ